MEIVDQSARSRPRSSRRLLLGALSAGLACTLGASLAAVAGASAARPADRGHPGHGGDGHGGNGGFGHRGLHDAISGTVSGVAADGSSFTLATGRNGLLQLTVDLQATTVYSEGGASSSITALRTGVKVRVRGTMTAANTITAASVDIAASSSATPTVSVEGTVTAVAASSFTLATGDNALVQITVDVSPTTTYRTSGSEPHPYGPWWGTTTTTTSTTSTTTSTTSTTTTVAPPPLGGVALGDHVEVRGTVSAPNTITATVVDIRSTGGVEVTGRVGVVGSSSFTLLHGRSSLNQITVDVTSSTTYSTFTPGPWRLEPTEEGTTTTTTLPGTTTTVSPTTPGLGSLVANDLVSVRGTVSAPNTITATTIVVLPASGAFPGRHGD